MDRAELARKCARIEAAGGSVRDFLQGKGFISPWGTWFRLQKEELGRKDYQITDGRGNDDMRKLTLEDKKKTVEVALGGGSPVKYLKELGVGNPSASWNYIKKTLKEADPKKYAQLNVKKEPKEEVIGTLTIEPSPAVKETIRAAMSEKPVTCCAPSTRKGVEVPDELPEEGEPVKPEVVLTIKSEDLTRAIDETPHVSSITKPLNYDGFEVTGLKTDYGRFQVSNNGYLFFGANADDELEMPVEIWRKFAEDLPRVMEILGIA